MYDRYHREMDGSSQNVHGYMLLLRGEEDCPQYGEISRNHRVHDAIRVLEVAQIQHREESCPLSSSDYDGNCLDQRSVSRELTS